MEGNKHIRWSLFVIAAPIIVQNLVQYVQLQVDMAMLGNYDVSFLAAVGNVLFPFTIVVSFLTALSAGATVHIAHYVGSRNLPSARRSAEVSFFYNLVLAIPLYFLLFQGAPTLLHWLGASEVIRTNAVLYLRWISYSVLFLGVELSIAAVLQGMGQTRPIMYAAMIRMAANILLDWLLIYGNLGMPELGIQGAGMATSLSNALAMLYLVISYACSGKYAFKPSMKGMLLPSWVIHRRNIQVGLPFGLEAILWNTGQVFIVRMVNEIDAFAAGTYILVSRIQAVTFFFYLGLARATMTLVGQSLGAGNARQARQVGYMSLRYALLLCLMASASFMAFPDQILRIFSKDGELIAGAVPLMFIIAITVFPVSVNVVIGNAIRGMKDTKWMFYTQSFGTLFTIILSALMLFVWEMELKGVFLTILFDECIRAALNYRHFMVLNRRKQDQGKQAAAQGSKAWSISGARYFKLWPRP